MSLSCQPFRRRWSRPVGTAEAKFVISGVERTFRLIPQPFANRAKLSGERYIFYNTNPYINGKDASGGDVRDGQWQNGTLPNQLQLRSTYRTSPCTAGEASNLYRQMAEPSFRLAAHVRDLRLSCQPVCIYVVGQSYRLESQLCGQVINKASYPHRPGPSRPLWVPIVPTEQDEQHSPYPAARARAREDRRLAMVAHRRALGMSRWAATPPQG
ncbi:hypothetical protein FBPa18_0070 [Pseudomonas phage vB_PaeP_FBPa18]|nr:hypothetical protein FBPa18_0070 [Pseudomonas phage vB_PaeP_FBPa18]